MKFGSGDMQGHWKWDDTIQWIAHDFIFTFCSNFGTSLYNFWDRAL